MCVIVLVSCTVAETLYSLWLETKGKEEQKERKKTVIVQEILADGTFDLTLMSSQLEISTVVVLVQL